MTTATIIRTSCGACGIAFGLEEGFYRSRQEDGASFYCPNGHFVGWADNENARLRRSLQKAQQAAIDARTQADAARKEADEQRLQKINARTHAKREVTKKRRAIAERKRLETRVKAGVCIKCHRHFPKLQRHMEDKHAKKAGRH